MANSGALFKKAMELMKGGMSRKAAFAKAASMMSNSSASTISTAPTKTKPKTAPKTKSKTKSGGK